MSEQTQMHDMPRPCEMWAERLAATERGDLSPSEQQALQAHVASCPACAAVLADYRAMDSGILALPAVEPLALSAIDSVLSAPVPQTTRSSGYDVERPVRGMTGAQSHVRSAALARFGVIAAAALIVGVIAGSFFLALSTHRFNEGNAGAPTPVRIMPAQGVTKRSLLCPSGDTTRAANMHPLALGTEPNLVYVDYERLASSPKAVVALLQRYDVITHQTMNIVKLPGIAITDAEVSPDGQWVMFALREAANTYQVRIVRVDGQDMQTLVCSAAEYLHVSWSPDQQLALITEMAASKPPAFQERFDLLSLATGSLQTLNVGSAGSDSYSSVPYWLSNTQFVISALTGDASGHYETTLYSITIDPSLRRQMNGPQQLTAPLPGAVAIAGSENGRLYISECGGGPKAAVPPCSISMVAASGGQPKVIHRTGSLAISAIRASGSGDLLLMVDSAAGDPSQNGVWKLTSSGADLTRLLPLAAGNLTTFNLFAVDAWANVSRDYRWYTLMIETKGSDLLAAGSMSGGPLTVITTLSQENLSTFGAVGWTTS